MIGIKCFLN